MALRSTRIANLRYTAITPMALSQCVMWLTRVNLPRIRTLLRFGYAHVQMMLYRPFLHYVSPRLSAGKNVDERYYACAAAGISVARNIVHIGMEIRKKAVVIGPYWFILYTQYFAILSLLFYALENPDKAGSPEILAEATAGRDVIASLSSRSSAADRVTASLNVRKPSSTVAELVKLMDVNRLSSSVFLII